MGTASASALPTLCAGVILDLHSLHHQIKTFGGPGQSCSSLRHPAPQVMGDDNRSDAQALGSLRVSPEAQSFYLILCE